MSSVSQAGGAAQIESVASQSAYQAGKAQETAKKTNVSGRTVGKPKLSEEGAKYYEELKKKYSNMEFVLVSSDMKEMAKAHAGSFASPNKMVVLIDDEKIERMATDENYRKQYESVLNQAASGVSQLKSQLEKTGANIKSFGVSFNDGGNASFFAVVDKSLSAQRDRIAKKRDESREAKKTQEKKAAEKKAEKKTEEKRQEKTKAAKDDDWGRLTEGNQNLEVITASSADELVKKVQDSVYAGWSDSVMTKEERQLGQHIDFRF